MSFKGFEFHTYKIPFLRRICSTPVSHVANVMPTLPASMMKHLPSTSLTRGFESKMVVFYPSSSTLNKMGSNTFLALPYSMSLQVYHTNQCFRSYFSGILFRRPKNRSWSIDSTGLNVRVMDIEVVFQMNDGEAVGFWVVVSNGTGNSTISRCTSDLNMGIIQPAMF